MFFFFFFQAEDGIRDSSVTGVQTCALPIAPGDGPGILLAGVEPVAEDPVRAQVGWSLEREANSRDHTESENERDRQEFRRRDCSTYQRAKIGRRRESLRGKNQSQSGKSQKDLEMAIVAQKRSRDEVIAGSLGR